MQDNYLREFDATVAKVGDGYVVLDQTAFYPEGGGQTSDQGELSNERSKAKVREVQKIEGEIRHLLDEQPFSVGDTIHGVIDWARRYECMRFHTIRVYAISYLPTCSLSIPSIELWCGNEGKQH